MCWSGEASAVLATVGIGTAAYCAYKKMHPTLWVTMGYFSLMELLQAFTYGVIDSCELPSNQIATLFGYLHIAFQPFFANALSMHFLPPERRRKIMLPAYSVCFIASIIMLMQLFTFKSGGVDWSGVCTYGQPMCSDILCSTTGNWHIAWNVPLNGFGFELFGHRFGAYYSAYFVAAFLMPLLYGVWRGTIFHLILGPGIAWLSTDNPNEWPAIWCLLSIGIIMLVIKIRCDPVLCEKFLRIKPRPHEVHIISDK